MLVDVARLLLEETRWAALATLGPDGAPFASLVSVALDADGAPLMLLSRLAVHTANLAEDPRASLLVASAIDSANPLAGARLTLTGTVAPTSKDTATRDTFLSRHPDAAAYADFADFGYFRFLTAGAHLVAGFGRIGDIPPSELRLPSH
jgi:putative heme iron utilization protein